MPVIRLKQATGSRMLAHQRNQFGTAASLGREDMHLSITLENHQDDDHAGFAPAALTRSFPSKQSLIALYGTLKRLAALLLIGQYRTDEKEESLNHRRRGQSPVTGPVTPHPEDKIFNQFSAWSLQTNNWLSTPASRCNACHSDGI